MSRLIVSPTVFTIAQSTINEAGLHAWAEYNDLLGEAIDSPINALMRVEVGEDAHRVVEFAGRHCYRSWKVGRERAEYIGNIIDQNHGSVLEHATLTFAIQGISRTLTHELVRHRVGVAISQESQRYVDAKDINFVVPPLLLHIAGGVTDPPHEVIVDFEEACLRDLRSYTVLQALLNNELSTTSRSPQTTVKKRVNESARALLPNASETRMTWTANMRILRHFLDMRGSQHADLEIRRLACHIHDEMTIHAPLFVCDFEQVEGEGAVNCVVRRNA